MMNGTQIKKGEDFEMNPPPGFTRKASNGQGMCTRVNNHDNIHFGLRGNLQILEAKERLRNAQIKKERDFEMQHSPRFRPEFSNGQGRSGTAAKEYDNIHSGLEGHLENLESEPSAYNGKEDASIIDSSDGSSEELSEEEYHCEQEPELVVKTDFYDFNRDKNEDCFAAGQIWAILGDLDVMPRLYARINEVCSPFKVNVTWLEFVAGDTDETAWERNGLPVACGKFEIGETSITIEDIDSFSHKIFGEKDVRKSYDIYPRKGETWGVYKNWNIQWSSDLDNHRECEYEFVVVLSDYCTESGIFVARLVKLNGFVCLFKPNSDNGILDSLRIPSNEMLRFSHRVPSFRTKGNEREDVPEGYFELDPCSLPRNLQELDTGVNDYDNRWKEDASISTEDKKADSSSHNAEEVPINDDYCKEEMVVEAAGSDFYDFDWNRTEELFAAGQMWAIFDDLDGMPRFYARITKVYSPFKVDVTWLEFVAGDTDEADWERNGLPVACGKFKLGETSITIEHLDSFSHEVLEEKDDESYMIYPRKGETWALYKNWSVKWSSDPDNHKEYDYDFVIVLSDYTKESGISVANLVKLKGFACLFQPTKKNGIMASFQIPSNEMLRFSHRVPSFRTKGNERNDVVPEGYFELDTCSLPSNLAEKSGSIDMEAETSVCNIDGSLISVSKEKHPMPKKRKIPDAEYSMDGSTPGGSKSLRMSNGCNKNSTEEKRAAETSGRPLDKFCNVSDRKKNVAAHAREMSPDAVNTTPTNEDEDIPSSPSSLKIYKVPATEFCNFNKERSCANFKAGQIWAMYGKLDKLPKKYALVEWVESFPVFKLAAMWLGSCDPPRGIISWVDKEMPVSCGTFKVTSDEVVVFDDSISFSHLLTEVPSVNGVYTIHPRAGEVWAIYNKFSPDLTCSDLKTCEYSIVEVLEVVGVRWIIVSILERVADFKTVFKAKEREGVDSIVAIPWIELYRFSHQVPSYILSEARYGKLRNCWELDPRSLIFDEPKRSRQV